jgi:DNA-binding SARP family transcriptional activator/tetratricopeptide (TPR) repeat protein
MGFDFRVLGPLGVARDGVVVSVGPVKQRVVLGSLLVRANQTVSVEVLAGWVWGGRPPVNVRATLQGYVMRLRRTLGDGAGGGGVSPIETRPEGYRLRVDDGGLDLYRFESLVGRARAAEREGDVGAALGLWRGALGEWRGEPLVDVPSEVLHREVVPGLVERRLLALEARIDADLRLGHSVDVAAELAELTGRHPLRERFWVQRMLALYRCDRTAEALECYRELRGRLGSELGIDPGDRVQELHVKILRADPQLRTAGPAVQAPEPSGASGDDTVTHGGPAGGDAPRSAPHQLPAAIGPLRGREDEITELDRRFGTRPTDDTAPALVGIVGAGGIGKTALALHWAHRHGDRFPDGRLYLNLRGYGPDAALEPGKALEMLLRTLRASSGWIPADLEERAALYRSAIGDRRMLIILDNARDSEQVRPLLPGSTCAVIVTSRNQLRGLTVHDGAHQIALRRIEPDATADLLADATARPAATFDAGEARRLTELCAGLPLAVRIVAERIARTGEELSAALAQLSRATSRLDELDSGDADVTDVRAVLSWSYRTLDAAAARAFRLLGMQPGPDIGLPAAAALLGEPQPAARRTLDRLIAVHLLERHQSDRYRMHDLLRIYAAERAGDADAAAVGDLLDWYLQTSAEAYTSVNPANARARIGLPGDRVNPLTFGGMKAGLDWFETEHQCLIAAADYASAHGYDEHTWKIVWSMTDFFIRGKPFGQWCAAATAGLAAARRTGSLTGQGEMLDHFGWIYADLRRWDEALDALHERLELSRTADSAEDEATAFGNIGWVLNRYGKYEQAVEYFTKAIEIFDRLGHELNAVPSVINLGYAYVQLARYREAFEHLERAMEIITRHGERRNLSFVLRNIGAAHAGMGEHETALDYFRQALAVNRYFSSRRLEASVLVSIGDSLTVLDRTTEARDHWTQALDIFTDLGAPEATEVRARLTASDHPAPRGD